MSAEPGRDGTVPERVLLLRLSSIGDVIHALPAFQSLRDALPDAEIGWAVERAAAPLVRRLQGLDHVHELGHDDVPMFTPEAVKGLEFDGVVVVNPHQILDADGDTPSRGARLLYVAMTRAVQELAFVTDAAAPPVIA